MKLQRRTVTVEARQWDPTHPDGTNYDELLEWGAPVLLGFNGASLSLSTSSGQTYVGPGDWIVMVPNTRGDHLPPSWQRVTEETLRRDFVEEHGEGDPFPGLQHASLDRVAFRRQTTTGWEYRQDGLTRAELQQGGWDALYTLNATDAEGVMQRFDAERRNRETPT